MTTEQKTTFTAGPWFHIPRRQLGDHRWMPAVVSTTRLESKSSEHEVAVLYGEGQEANANLLAAAPDLYDIAERFLNHLEWLKSGRISERGMDSLNENLAAVKAVLAKARGEAS